MTFHSNRLLENQLQYITADSFTLLSGFTEFNPGGRITQNQSQDKKIANPDRLFPTELPEFFFGANELHCTVIKQNTPALRIMIVESKQLRPAVLIPTRFRLEQ